MGAMDFRSARSTARTSAEKIRARAEAVRAAEKRAQELGKYTRIDAGTGRERPLGDEDWPQNK